MRVICLVKCFLGLVSIVLSENSAENDISDSYRTVPELIEKNGYAVEIHQVTTSDGYILEMHRIPHGKTNGEIQKRPVIFLQHGLLCSSADWIVTGPKQALGYVAADQGFDVWIGNGRGNTYSSKHLTLSPNDPKFWDYSFHEHGVYDLPAMIDHALNVSGQEKLYYVGHSQGTTEFFVMCSEKPEYNKKIAAQFSLAPVAFMKHFKNPIFRVVAFNRIKFESVFRSFNWNNILPKSRLNAEISRSLCSKGANTADFCSHFLFLVFGYNMKGLDKERLPVIMAHTPAGGSVKEFMHLAQLIETGIFANYDYGPLNKNYYGTDNPTSYNLSRVTVPVALYYSKNDLLGSERDVQKLYDNLKNPIGIFKVEDELFNHGDFIVGKHAADLLYYKILDLARKYK